VTERQGTTSSVQYTDERLLELEAENTRLKSLVAELLVTNQVLRESKDGGSIKRYRSERADT
jgi:hypothetical protein